MLFAQICLSTRLNFRQGVVIDSSHRAESVKGHAPTTNLSRRGTARGQTGIGTSAERPRSGWPVSETPDRAPRGLQAPVDRTALLVQREQELSAHRNLHAQDRVDLRERERGANGVPGCDRAALGATPARTPAALGWKSASPDYATRALRSPPSPVIASEADLV